MLERHRLIHFHRNTNALLVLGSNLCSRKTRKGPGRVSVFNFSPLCPRWSETQCAVGSTHPARGSADGQGVSWIPDRSGAGIHPHGVGCIHIPRFLLFSPPLPSLMVRNIKPCRGSLFTKTTRCVCACGTMRLACALRYLPARLLCKSLTEPGGSEVEVCHLIV